jgi:alkylhydroperoxidase/carboxymuconolactone decarboxylase family protein YurZ
MTASDEFSSIGQALRIKMFGDEVASKHASFPEFDSLTRDIVFGRVWSRPQLDLRTRSLCQVAALTVLNMPDHLQHPMTAALRNGATADELKEVILQMAFYGGWPCASTAFSVFARVLGDKDESSSPR